MDRPVEKLLYSRRETAEALSLSIRSVDYLITTDRLPTRRIGTKILIPADAVRRFARQDHPEVLRVAPSHTPSNIPTRGPFVHSPGKRFEPCGESDIGNGEMDAKQG
jgi:hypothetical protein